MAVKAPDARLVFGGQQFGNTVTLRREDYEALANARARDAQRLRMLLSLLSNDELRRIGLVPSDAPDPEEGQSWNYSNVVNALDAKVDTFNAAHQRLTRIRPKRRKSVTLDQVDAAAVIGARMSGVSVEAITKSLDKLRGQIEAARASAPIFSHSFADAIRNIDAQVSAAFSIKGKK